MYEQIITLLCLVFLILVGGLVYGVIWYNTHPEKMKVIENWLFFTVIIALLPLIFQVIYISYISEEELSLLTVLAKGDLFIISVAICADGIGRVFASKKDIRGFNLKPIAVCIILIAFSSGMYAAFSLPDNPNHQDVPMLSSSVFVISLISSLMCLVMSSED